MVHGQKVKIMEKDQKTNPVFQSNQIGLKMLEGLKIWKKD